MKKAKEDELFAERMQASKLKINGQVILGRANYQLKIEDSIRTLDKDVERLSRLGRTRIDALDDMERRLKRMRHQLKVTSVPTVNDRIAADLYLNNKANVENKFSVCPRCNRKILTNLLQVHDLACARLQSDDTKFLGLRPVPNVGEEIQSLIDEHAVFVPQPPRRVRVKQKGTSYIVWEWDKPVYEGGWPVTDYEISYAANIADFNTKTKKYDRYREVCPSLSTSNWCFSEPITHNGYTMVNLRAGTEYTDLLIRCRNKHGWSEWVEMVSSEEDKYDPFAGLNNIKTDKVVRKRMKTPGVTTNPAEPATPPLYFLCSLITTSCVHLQWDTPFYDGGLPIVEYAVHYTVMEHVPTATDRDRVEERPNKVIYIPSLNTHSLNTHSLATAASNTHITHTLINRSHSTLSQHPFITPSRKHLPGESAYQRQRGSDARGHHQIHYPQPARRHRCGRRRRQGDCLAI